MRNLILDRLELDPPHHDHEEDEQLGLGQGLSQTKPLTVSKWNKILGFVKFSLFIDKSVRIEHFWFVPEGRICQKLLDICLNEAIFWKHVTRWKCKLNKCIIIQRE